MAFKVFLKSGNTAMIDSAVWDKLTLNGRSIYVFYSDIVTFDSIRDDNSGEGLNLADAFFDVESVEGIRRQPNLA